VTSELTLNLVVHIEHSYRVKICLVWDRINCWPNPIIVQILFLQ